MGKMQGQCSMFSASNRPGQKAIMDSLIGLIVPITAIPPGVVLAISVMTAMVAYAFGYNGLEHGTNIMSETAGPMIEITVKLILAVYLALVIFFCHCWDHGTRKIFDLTKNFIRDLLHSANFRALHPRQTNRRLVTSALDLPNSTCISRPERERPQFIAGDDPPLIYS